MDTTILVALITGACAVIGNVVISARNTKDLFAKLDKRSELADAELKNEVSVFRAEIVGEIGLLKADIADLRKTVDRHNKIVERTYSLESKTAVMEEQIAVANKRIKNLESR